MSSGLSPNTVTGRFDPPPPAAGGSAVCRARARSPPRCSACSCPSARTGAAPQPQAGDRCADARHHRVVAGDLRALVVHLEAFGADPHVAAQRIQHRTLCLRSRAASTRRRVEYSLPLRDRIASFMGAAFAWCARLLLQTSRGVRGRRMRRRRGTIPRVDHECVRQRGAPQQQREPHPATVRQVHFDFAFDPGQPQLAWTNTREVRCPPESVTILSSTMAAAASTSPACRRATSAKTDPTARAGLDEAPLPFHVQGRSCARRYRVGPQPRQAQFRQAAHSRQPTGNRRHPSLHRRERNGGILKGNTAVAVACRIMERVMGIEPR